MLDLFFHIYGTNNKNTGLQFLSTSVPRFNYNTGRIRQLRRFGWAIIGDPYENDSFPLIYCQCGWEKAASGIV